MRAKINPFSFILTGSALLALAACGGGNGGTSTPDTPSTPVTLAGKVVVDQAIKNAVVCLDINANNTCDATEPASAKTGIDGTYRVTYDPAIVTAAQVSSASLIAPMVPGATTDPTTTIDAADPTVANATSAYVLKQTPGKAGQINPLTTLIATGVAQGMTEDVARTNVAAQLAIADAKIDDYQDDIAFDQALIQDNARVMARVTAAALQAGAVLQVGEQRAAGNAAAGNLATLRYTDASNYSLRTLDIQANAAGSSPQLITDARIGKTNGAPTPEGTLYNQAYLSGAGWLRCSLAVPLTSTRGNPSRSTYCNTQSSVGFTTSFDLAGQAMASVVTAMQADQSTNTINNALPTASLIPALGAATFPANASVQMRSGINLNTAIYINDLNADALPSTFTTLEQVIAAYPSTAFVAAAAGRTTLSLGLQDSETRVLRVAFSDASSSTTGNVQFYGCDWNGSALSNCTATQTGTYAISTVNGVRVMRYAGHAETIMNHTRLQAEVKALAGITDNSSRIFIARESKTTLAFRQSGAKRLNAEAWGAMRSQLGM